MKNEMRLQGIGMVEGTEAGKIQVGDILRWNHGGLSKVISFELSKTGKTINCQVEVVNSRTGEKEIYERSMRVTRLVNIVASANTNNDFNLQFDPIKEEAPEAEEVAEVEEVKDFKRYTELLEKVYGMKTTTTEEEKEELERLGYKLKLNGVPDVISEMNFNRLEKLVEVAEAKKSFLIEALLNACSPEEEAFIKERLQAPKPEKVLVTWFDYSKDESIEKEITDNQLQWLRKQNHIEVEKVGNEVEEMLKVGDKVLFNVNWTSKKEKETIGEVTEIKNGLFTVYAYGNYFFKKANEINLIKSGGVLK